MLQFTPGDMLERYGAYPLREVAWLTAREFAGQYEFLREVIRVEFDKLHRQMDLPISHFEGGILGWRRFGGWLGRPAGDDTFSFYFPEEPGRTPGHAISNAVVSVSRWLLARIQGSAFWQKLLRELDP